MKIKCIALDLDRTTLDSQGHLSEINRRAIESAVAAGLHVVVASGRALDSLPAGITEIRGIQYAITSNGAAARKEMPETVQDDAGIRRRHSSVYRSGADEG